jgi:hypothetical protein
MKTFIAFAGSYITFGGFMILQSPGQDPVDQLMKFTCYIALFIPFIAYALFIGLGIFAGAQRLANSLWNRYAFLLISGLLFVVPFDKRLLLNDFLFNVLLFIVIWCWVSWVSFLFRAKTVG